MSAQRLLFQNCKEGNLSDLKRVVELKDVDLNVRDCWDSTPLYYACLCGHKDIVEYLLQNGSKCEASSFDGERCLYGALTNDIKNLLLNWKQINSTVKKRDRHYELLRFMFEDDKLYQDIRFGVHASEIGAHRCILATRSHFFAEALSTKWENENFVSIKSERVSSEAFYSMLQFLYLGRTDVKRDAIADLKRLANYCKLPNLFEEIVAAENKILNLTQLKPRIACKVKIITIESEASRLDLSSDLRQLAESTFPIALRNWIDEGVLPFSYKHQFYPDVRINVNGYEFLCHKVFLCGCSDYFKALFSDHFNENLSNTSIKLRHVSAEIFQHVIIYIYSGTCEVQSVEMALEILPVADMMLLMGLKRHCGNVLAHCLIDTNVVDMYRCAQTFNIPSLEDRCTSYMAAELETLVEDEDFIELVMSDAFSVKHREETDSIPIVDDIRCHLTDATVSFSQMEEAQRKLGKLDAMLARIGLEC